MAKGEAFNSADRELCPDGACIGLIGPDGRCKECGSVSPTATQDPRNRGLRSDEEVEEELGTRGLRSDEEVEEKLEQSRVTGSIEPAPDDFEDRELCPDGACVGVIGDDGRCRECGAGGPSDPA